MSPAKTVLFLSELRQTGRLLHEDSKFLIFDNYPVDLACNILKLGKQRVGNYMWAFVGFSLTRHLKGSGRTFESSFQLTLFVRGV